MNLSAGNPDGPLPRRNGAKHGLQAELFFQAGHIGLIHEAGFGKVVLTFSLLLGQDMALESVFPFDLSRCRELETLFGTGFGL